MKKILLSVLALLAFTFGGTAQTLPSYVPANGLVGWWPFNGNANDESGNNNNGTVNGATLTADRFGNAGKAYRFDGVTQNILLGDISAMEGNSHSISAWVNVNQFNPIYTDIITKEGEVISQKQWVLHLNNKKIRNAIFTTNNEFVFNSNKSLIEQNWFHIVKTWNSTESKTYINGELDSTISTNGSIVQASHNIAVGGNSFPTHYLNGKVDDIIFYNRALTQQEITGLYQGANTAANCPTFPASLTQGLVGYWPFCGNALDESGNSNHGTVNGATLTQDRFGNNNFAYSFNGTSDYIKVSDNDMLDLTQNLTLSAWIKTNSSTNEQGILGKGKSINSTGYSLLHNVLTPQKTGISIQNDPIPSSVANINSSEISPDNWNHLIGTYNGSELKFYLNGILINTTTTSLQLMPNSLSDLFIGCELVDFRFFNGIIDDVAIWNRALTPQEIQQVYNQGICQTSITVTDTLLIHTGITSYNPVAYQNTVKVWPNPGNTAITLDAGNLALMQGWRIRISNAQGAQIYPATGQSGLISQQQQTLNMSGWGGNGLYFLYLIDPQNNIQEVKKIVLAP